MLNPSAHADGTDSLLKHAAFPETKLISVSPASEAGLQKDDVIIRIDDKQGTDLTLTKMNEMLEQPVSRSVTIRRGEQTLKVTVTPRKLI